MTEEKVSKRSRVRDKRRIRRIYNREFDPGSGRTLAACLTHASRTDLIERSFRMEFEKSQWRTGE